MKHLTPQEIEVYYIIPSLRKQIALKLKTLGLKQKEIANKLYITEAAISNYLKEKRGNEITFNQKILAEIEETAKKIKKGKDYRIELQKLLKKIKNEKILCDACYNFSKIKNCDICFQK